MENSELRPALAAAPSIRQAELERIIAFVQAARDSALLIAGGPELGKSRLLDAVGANVTDAVYQVRINPAEAMLARSGLSAILAAFRTPEAVALSEELLSESAGQESPAAQASESPSPTPTETPPASATPEAPRAPVTAGRQYPWHTGIVSTTFWVGESFDPNASDGSQMLSTYDSQWMANYGGCDGNTSTGSCETEARTSANRFFPTRMTPGKTPSTWTFPSTT